MKYFTVICDVDLGFHWFSLALQQFKQHHQDEFLGQHSRIVTVLSQSKMAKCAKRLAAIGSDAEHLFSTFKKLQLCSCQLSCLEFPCVHSSLQTLQWYFSVCLRASVLLTATRYTEQTLRYLILNMRKPKGNIMWFVQLGLTNEHTLQSICVFSADRNLLSGLSASEIASPQVPYLLLVCESLSVSRCEAAIIRSRAEKTSFSRVNERRWPLMGFLLTRINSCKFMIVQVTPV